MSWLPSHSVDLERARNSMLADSWWIVALRGVLAILFGTAAFVVPAATMLAFVIVFAAYSFVDGIFNIALSVGGARKGQRWGLLLLNGLFEVAIGVAAAMLPGISVLAFILIIAAWALVSGGLMLGAAFTLKVTHGRWFLVFGAIASLLYGLLLLVSPFIGALVLTWWIGAHALVFGVTLIVLAFRLHKHRGEGASNASTASQLHLGRPS